jgi:large subunit ribosomal protein L31
MKEGIHPNYDDVLVKCHCGSIVATRSTRTKGGEIHTEICSQCHPFYTGKQKVMDTEGRIDRFRKKYGQI